MMVKDLEQQAKDEADRKAREIISLAIQRCAAEDVAERLGREAGAVFEVGHCRLVPGVTYLFDVEPFRQCHRDFVPADRGLRRDCLAILGISL